MPVSHGNGPNAFGGNFSFGFDYDYWNRKLNVKRMGFENKFEDFVFVQNSEIHIDD